MTRGRMSDPRSSRVQDESVEGALDISKRHSTIALNREQNARNSKFKRPLDPAIAGYYAACPHQLRMPLRIAAEDAAAAGPRTAKMNAVNRFEFCRKVGMQTQRYSDWYQYYYCITVRRTVTSVVRGVVTSSAAWCDESSESVVMRSRIQLCFQTSARGTFCRSNTTEIGFINSEHFQAGVQRWLATATRRLAGWVRHSAGWVRHGAGWVRHSACRIVAADVVGVRYVVTQSAIAAVSNIQLDVYPRQTGTRQRIRVR